MKMLIVIYNVLLDEQVKKILHEKGVRGYSEIPRVYGAGEAGAVEDSRHLPGYNASIFAALGDEQIGPVVESLREFSEEHHTQYHRPMPLRAFVTPCDQVL